MIPGHQKASHACWCEGGHVPFHIADDVQPSNMHWEASTRGLCQGASSRKEAPKTSQGNTPWNGVWGRGRDEAPFH